jgi:hypothetical protein
MGRCEGPYCSRARTRELLTLRNGPSFVILAAAVAQNRHAALLGVSITPSGRRQQSAASASENQETCGVAYYGNVPFAWCDVF